MPDKYFDHVEALNSTQFNMHCQCGNEVRSIDGDCANVDIGQPVRGVGWMIWEWDCPECGNIFSLSLGVVSNPIDDMIAIDNFKEAKSSRMVLLKKDDVTVFGVEHFEVEHANPVADFDLRHYECMAEYIIGPVKDKMKLSEMTRKVAGVLINRVQVEMPLANKINDAL